MALFILLCLNLGKLIPFQVDFWNEPRVLDVPILFRLEPRMIKAVEDTLTRKGIEYDIVFYDLQR